MRSLVDKLYEPKTFTLKDGRLYTPDFYLPETKEWIEIKGDYKKQKNYNKAFIFAETFLNEKITLIREKEMKNIYNLNLSHKYLSSIVSKFGGSDIRIKS